MESGFPGGSGGKGSACDAGDPSWILESVRAPGEWQPTPYSCLESSMVRGAWHAPVSGGLTLSLHFHFLKWNHTVHNVWGLVFSSQHDSLWSHPGLCVPLIADQYSLAGIFHCLLPIHFLKDIWILSSLGFFFFLSCYEHSYTGFCVNVSFHFKGLNAQECNCQVV